MPEAGQQTALSVLVTGDWVWLQDEYHAGSEWPEDSSSGGASAGSATEMSVDPAAVTPPSMTRYLTGLHGPTFHRIISACWAGSISDLGTENI